MARRALRRDGVKEWQDAWWGQPRRQREFASILLVWLAMFLFASVILVSCWI